MALPTATKTWQYDVNQTLYNATHEPNIDEVWLAVVASLTGFASNPWTVWGSSDGAVAGNGDSIDRWIDAGDLVHATGAHSWTVIEQSQVGVKICIDLRSSTPGNFELTISKTGFGVANGGTDGTTSTRPTATDEVIVWTLGNGFFVTPSTYKLHVKQSSDGQSTRLILCRAGLAVWYWAIELANNPVGGWAGESVALLVDNGANADIPTYVQLNDNPNVHAWIGGVATQLHVTAEGYGAATIGEQQSYPDDDTAAWPLGGAALFSATGSHRGRKGELIDVFWASTANSTGEQYPAAATRLMSQFGHLAEFWDGTVVQVS